MIRKMLAVFLLVAGPAHACLFAANAQPKDWDEWAASLFAADVTAIRYDTKKALDLISVKVVETFKGPRGASATLEVPSRLWTSCGLPSPKQGGRVLVALNANGDTLVVPLTESYIEALRKYKPSAR
jgi:hypothetical protein